VSPEVAGAIPPLRPVPLQELRLRSEAQVWEVNQKLADLESLTPVRGQVRARHHGSVLEVDGEAETIVTLCCDRCLQHFNQPLRTAEHELLALAGAGAGEADESDLTALASSQATSRSQRPEHEETLLVQALDDRLDPRGDFDPERWLFEQLSLQLPVVNRCGADCPGPPLAPAAGSSSSSAQEAISPPASGSPSPTNDGGAGAEPDGPIDPRWQALRQLLA
jgi:uncharacterized protein